MSFQQFSGVIYGSDVEAMQKRLARIAEILDKELKEPLHTPTGDVLLFLTSGESRELQQLIGEG